jgi:hypothetical protein
LRFEPSGRHQPDGAHHSPEVPSLAEVELDRVLFDTNRLTQLEPPPSALPNENPDFSTASVIFTHRDP